MSNTAGISHIYLQPRGEGHDDTMQGQTEVALGPSLNKQRLEGADFGVPEGGEREGDSRSREEGAVGLFESFPRLGGNGRRLLADKQCLVVG